MKIVHVVPTIDKSAGGPSRSVTDLVFFVSQLEKVEEVLLFTLKSEDPIFLDFDSKKARISFFESSNTLKQALENLFSLNDDWILHIQGVWHPCLHNACKVAKKNNVPYIVTPRGMLEPWSLRQKRLKKLLALSFYQKKDLKQANCIHATAKMEGDNVRLLGVQRPIAVIPNGISLDKVDITIPEKSEKPKKILFLSRIHKKKGIENLINAWELIPEDIRQGWVIDIVGNGELGYILDLKNFILNKGLDKEIVIKDPIYGEKKNKVFRESTLFVLPTFSENFGIVIAEALANYTPVITTKGTPWENLHHSNCGWWVDIGVHPLKEALLQALSMNKNDLLEMGINGRKLIENKYSNISVAYNIVQLYSYVHKKQESPSFVY